MAGSVRSIFISGRSGVTTTFPRTYFDFASNLTSVDVVGGFSFHRVASLQSSIGHSDYKVDQFLTAKEALPKVVTLAFDDIHGDE